jgi:hypothetical protein
VLGGGVADGQRRRVLDVRGGGEEEVGLLVENLLTPDECAFYVRHLDEAGMQPLAAGSTSSSSASASGEGEFPAHYRTSDRLLTLSPDAARALFERLLPCLRPSGVLTLSLRVPCAVTAELIQCGLGFQMRWGCPWGRGLRACGCPWGSTSASSLPATIPVRASSISPQPGCAVMCRSSSFPRADVTGGHFSAHIDGPWVPSAKRASMFTVVIYLNDARSQPPCVGGHTNFLRPAIITPQAQRITVSAAAESHIARCAHHGCLLGHLCSLTGKFRD